MIWLILLLAADAWAIDTSATVSNTNPTVTYCAARSLLEHGENELYMCRNMGSLEIYVELNATDRNGYGQLRGNGSASCLVDNLTSGFVEMFYAGGAGWNAEYELVKNASLGQYSIDALVDDGTTEFHMMREVEFSVAERDCTAYTAKLDVGKGVYSLDAPEMDSTIYIQSLSQNSSIAVILSEDEPRGVKNPGAQSLAYIELAMRGNESAMQRTELQYRYELQEGIDEGSIRLMGVAGGGWHAVPGGVDTEGDYVYGFVTWPGTYAVLANRIMEDEECTPQWQCSAWGLCLGDSFQERECLDLAGCGQERPIERKACIYSNYPLKDALGREPTLNLTQEPPEEEVLIELPMTLFDIYIDLIEDVVDTELLFQVGLINFGDPGEVEARILYTITDSNGYTVYQAMESRAVQTQLEFLKAIDVSGLQPGRYSLELDLEYIGQSEPASTLRQFEVAGEGINMIAVLQAAAGGLFLVLLLIILVEQRLAKDY